MLYIDRPLPKEKKEKEPLLHWIVSRHCQPVFPETSRVFPGFSMPSSCRLLSPETEVTYLHAFSSQNTNILNKLGTHLIYLYQVFNITFSYQLNRLLCDCHIC